MKGLKTEGYTSTRDTIMSSYVSFISGKPGYPPVIFAVQAKNKAEAVKKMLDEVPGYGALNYTQKQAKSILVHNIEKIGEKKVVTMQPSIFF